MARLTSRDGRRWRVGRRWLPWAPKQPWGFRLMEVGLHLSDAIMIVGVLVMALSLPFVLVYLIHLTLNLLLTPFALIGRAMFGRPWTVVAYRVGEGPEYRGQAADGDSADQLVTRVRAEITEYGTPKSLTARPMRSKWGW